MSRKTSGRNKTRAYPTIKVEGATSPIYRELLKLMEDSTLFQVGDYAKNFWNRLSKIVEKGEINSFEVPAYDPSINNGKLSFIPFRIPATGFTPEELEQIASENQLRIGTFSEYILFCATLLYKAIQGEFTLDTAWHELNNCMQSSFGSKLSRTGCKGIAGKYDLGNTHKILRGSKLHYVVLSGNLLFINVYDQLPDYYSMVSVGWFIR